MPHFRLMAAIKSKKMIQTLTSEYGFDEHRKNYCREPLKDAVAKSLDRTGSPGHESLHKLSQSDRDSKSWGIVANEGLPVLSSPIQGFPTTSIIP